MPMRGVGGGLRATPHQGHEAFMEIAMIQAEPTPLSIDLDRTALLIIDMQRDFLEPGGFGAALGNDVSRLQAAVATCRELLAAARRGRTLTIHARKGHRTAPPPPQQTKCA